MIENLEFLLKGTYAYVIGDKQLDDSIYLQAIGFHIAEKKKTVKVEGLENHFSEYLPATVHCYISPAGAPSFKEHTDPYDVKIKCISGTKTMEINGERVEIGEGQEILIPANVPHKATNEFDSVMLSIGYEK